MAGLEGAIKELLKEELKVITDEQTKQDERNQALEKAVTDLSGKIVEREREADTLREGLEKCRQDCEASNEKSQTELGEDVKLLKERLDRAEDDAEGIGGLKQVHEKCSNLEQTLSDILPKFEESMRHVKENTTRTEEFDQKLRDLSRQCDKVLETLKVSEERVTSMEDISRMVKVGQEALEDSVSRKYEKLWEDVLHAMEETKGGQLEVMQKALDSKQEASKLETRSLVNYALNFMASAHGERRQMALNRGLVVAWKEQTWISARRRMGLTYLRKIFMGRQRGVWDVFNRQMSASIMLKRVEGQYEEQLGSVYKEIEDKSKHLQKHCAKLDDKVATLHDEKAATTSLDAAIAKLSSALQEGLKALVPINAKLEEHEVVQERHGELHSQHSDSEATLDAKISGLGRDLADVIEGCAAFAKSEEVKSMIRDVLLIWNSIKQLDLAKADKKDVDSFALETGSRDKLSQRRLEDLESDLASKSRTDTLRSQDKLTEIEGRLDESGRQFRHWEQMWEKLSGFVEDLVTKISDLQGGDHKLPSTMRTPVRTVSRENLARSRADIPTLPTPGVLSGNDSAATTRPAIDRGSHHHHLHQMTAEGHDAKMLWINSAKGIVDATIDQAVYMTPNSARPRSRPKSASSSIPRRPHDRAR